ncbi:MAG: ABC transporter ATP-binding protein [Candidatus Shapirobacteria bacterium]
MPVNKGKIQNVLKSTFWVTKLLFKFSPGLFIAVFVTQTVTSISPFLTSKIFSQLIDSLTNSNKQYWIQPFTYFLIVGFVSSLFFFFQGQLNRVLDIKLQAYLRKLFIAKVANLDYQHLESKDTSALISKVDEEFGWRIRQTVSDLSNLFFNLMSLVAITVIILPKYPMVWLLIMISQIPEYLVERFWVKKDWQVHEANSDKNKEMWDLNWTLRQKNFVAELRINNAVDYLVSKFNNLFDFFANQRVSIRVAKTPSEIILTVLSTIVGGIGLGIIINDVVLGILTIGSFTFYFDTMRRVGNVFQSFVYTTVAITENSYHIDNFKEVLELNNIMVGGTKKITTTKPPEVEFRDVSFKYPDSDRYVFEHLNLTISSNEEIALVGENGAGKSTLIKLTCCFYYPTTGQILINGIDTRDIDMQDWYKHLSYLTQEFNIYGNLTLAENVTIGDPNKKVIEKNVLKALDSADANFWRKYKKGIDTPLSPRYGGEEPSWGQGQKISIARVFYRDSSVMILDEPTASIDAVSEYKIFSNLYKQVKNKTLLIVSHRFSTVRNAKRIIVIDKGIIVEQGSHEELLAINGLYSKSFKLQAEGYN